MIEKYQTEINEFADRFGKYKGARIVLYGIGRYTATLLEGLRGTAFHFVGLMDKDPNNQGKEIFGVPVIDKETAETIADMVVINTSETYWSVIYNRIQDIKLPVFFKNGELAQVKDRVTTDNPFRDLSDSDLRSQIQNAEVVSFDFFDTLFMRSTCNPQDILNLLDRELKAAQKGLTDFLEIRNSAKKKVRNNYSLDELYSQMESSSKMPHAVWEEIEKRELELEKRQLVPRQQVLNDLRWAIESGKEIYIVSDMYLPETFYRDIFAQYSIAIPAGHILLSNVLDAAKADGSMWRYYSERIVKGRLALHVGDNRRADIEIPVQYGLQTYQTPCAWDMLLVSSIKEAASQICCDYDTAVMGCVLKELFGNPFALNNADGAAQIDDDYEMGYCVFGPVILTFLLWLLEKSKEAEITKLVFMSRDGYFLKEDFEFLCALSGEERNCCYLGISRQLAMTAAIESREDLLEFLSMPYTGGIPNLFEDRLGICGVAEIPNGRLEDYIERYNREIEAHISRIKQNYRKYINQMQLDETCAIVDLGYYGNNQRYLNKLLKISIPGYYFNANCSNLNRNTEAQKMTACFQGGDDPAGENSQILKRMIYLESFLTAPYGMVREVDGDGAFVCAPQGENQRHFQDKLMINQGVRRLISDYMERFGVFKLRPNCKFADWLYGYYMGGALTFAEGVKRSFYNDNAMMNRIESALFY